MAHITLSVPITLVSLFFLMAVIRINAHVSERLDFNKPENRVALGFMFLACVVSGIWFGHSVANDLFSLYKALRGIK